MRSEFLIHSIRFVFLVLLQVLILNNIRLSGYLNPFLYTLFVLMLPFCMQSYLVMLLAFALGLCIDMFSDTGGLHAGASVLLAFLRPFVLKLLSPRDGYESFYQPSLQYFGFNWFFSYTVILVATHHLFLFYMEVFRFSEFFSTLLRSVLSTLFTLTLAFISQFFFSKRIK